MRNSPLSLCLHSCPYEYRGRNTDTEQNEELRTDLSSLPKLLTPPHETPHLHEQLTETRGPTFGEAHALQDI